MTRQSPLLDHQYNPTEALRSFSDAVFHYLDAYYEPRGTQLLEPEKMKTLLSLLSPPKEAQVCLQIGTMFLNATFLAFPIETVFTSLGPSVTRAGLLTYLRSEIMADPDSAFSGFERVNQVMRLSHPFARWQFPQVAEPRAKELGSYIETSVGKALRDMGWSSTAGQDEELQAVKARIALEQMGQQNALDLISPSVCYRCRRYPCTCYGVLDLI